MAQLFIDEVLKKAVIRCRESYEEEEDLTLAELKRRTQGKKEWSHRSNLHDDITVVIYHFMADGTSAASINETYSKVVDAALATNESQMLTMAREIFDKIDVDGSGTITADELALLARRAGRPIEGAALVKTMQELDKDGSGEVDFGEFSDWWPKYCNRLTSSRNRSGFDGVLGSAVDEVASQQTEGRVHFDAQLLQVVKFLEGKDAGELKVEFETLDVDKSGELDLDEVLLLVQKVRLSLPDPHPILT